MDFHPGHDSSKEEPDGGTTSNQDEAQQLLPHSCRASSDVSSCRRDHAAALLVTNIPPLGSKDEGQQATTTVVGSLSIASSRTTGSAHTWAVVCVCGAHALARWGWRTWEFAVVRRAPSWASLPVLCLATDLRIQAMCKLQLPVHIRSNTECRQALILIKLFPTSLLLVSIFGLLDNLMRLMFGAAIGQYVDRTERLRGALTCYAIQNVCIATSAAAAAALLLLDGAERGTLPASQPAVYRSLIAVTLLAGASSSIGSLGAAVAVEREYVKALCADDSGALAKLNATMRAIDLLSQMLGPVASGLLMSYSSMLVAVVVLLGYSLAAWLPEAWLMGAAHTHSQRLRQPKPIISNSQQKRQSALRVLLGGAGYATYFKQQVLLPGLALSVLYLTVLSLGFLMTSFLAWQGLSEATISLFRSAGALAGLMATVLFHPLQRCGVSLVGAGGLGITWQLVCLFAGVVPIVVAQVLLGRGTATMLVAADSAEAVPAATQLPGEAAEHTRTLPLPLLYALLTGLVLSRCGLWLFDLAISQLQQELVPQSELGTVSGVQASLQSAFEIMSFVAGAVFSDPRQFHWLMVGSCAAVATGAGLFYRYAWKAGYYFPVVVGA